MALSAATADESSSEEGEIYTGVNDFCDLLDECDPTESSAATTTALHHTSSIVANHVACGSQENQERGVAERKAANDDQTPTMTMEINAYPAAHSAASITQTASVTLSACCEASVRLMLQLPSSTRCLSGRVVDWDGTLLCETDMIPLWGGHDDAVDCETWIPLSVSDNSLQMCTVECSGGWTICFDVKDVGHGTVLRSVHVMRASNAMLEQEGPGPHVPERAPNSVYHSAACFDCDDVTAVEAATTQARDNMQKAKHQADLGFGLNYKKEEDLASPRGLDALDAILGEGGQLPAFLLDQALWRSIAGGLRSLSVTEPTDGGSPTVDELRATPTLDNLRATEDRVQRLREDLDRVGYGRLPDLSWSENGVDVGELAALAERLRLKGLPPVLVFLYDQAWLVWERLYDTMAAVMRSEAIELDLAVFAWALGGGGGNFGKPHRDDNYDECHKDGKVASLTVWLPLVPVTPTNGCMYVVPSDRDPLFAKPRDSMHMVPHLSMPWAEIRPLQANAGELLVWKSNLIHWGSACDVGTEETPRKSLGSAFMLPGVAQSPLRQHLKSTQTITKERLRQGLGLESRLRVCLRSLKLYSAWFPEFDKFFDALGSLAREHGGGGAAGE